VIVPAKLDGSESAIVWVKSVPENHCVIKVLIICGIYYQTKSKTKYLLIYHITTNYNSLKTKYNGANFIFAGDYNDLSPNIILQQSASLRQSVHYPTCFPGKTTIDLIVNDLHQWYQPPTPQSPLIPDPEREGCPSDHVVNIMFPKEDTNLNSSKIYNTVKVRPITKHAISAIGNMFGKHNWEEVLNEPEPDDKLSAYKNTIEIVLDSVAPMKEVKIAGDEPAWMNSGIKMILRKRDREYNKKGKSDRWRTL